MTTSYSTADVERIANTVRAERLAAMATLGITFADIKADTTARAALKAELGRRGWLPSSPVITGIIPTAGSPLTVAA